MSVQTAADDHKDQLMENISDAIDNLSAIVIEEVWGWDEYTAEHLQVLRDTLNELLNIRARLRNRTERLEEAVRQEQERICKHCCHFNWKVSGNQNWGECLNPKVQAATRLSLKLVDLDDEKRREVSQFTRIHFDEDAFGCIMFE